ncbi:hypothetical protein AOLI_G00185540 [Acnodon oligacanthus]
MASFLNINSETGVILALKSFDFETIKTFQFHVLATDSGTPPLSSNVTVNVFILDQNDNVPVILYPVSSNGSAEGVEEVPRNVNAGHLVTKVRAYDADIGYNGWLLFSLQEVSDHSLFGLDRYTGQIRTLRSFTETDEAQHKLVILVKDNGNVSLSATATVIIKVVEPKEAFAASDVKHAVKDEEDSDVTFYLIITLGSVSVLFVISIIVLIVMQCSKSTDYSSKYLQDTNYDGTLCHSIQYRSGDKRYMLVGPRMSIGSTIVPGSNGNTLVVPDRRRRTSGEILRDDGSQDGLASFLNVNSETGVIRALKSFDFETSKTFQFHVLATDSGTPPLSSNVTVNVFILDQNDNVPVILYPVSSNGSAEGVEEVPRNVNAGHLVTKVRAYDADIGYNGWLLFSLQEVSDHSLFGLDRYTGQIRTLRSFTETDEAQHKLVILVKDNGNISLSATATVIIKVVEPKEAFAASDVKHAVKDEEDSDVTFYLIITLGSVSVLFVISIIVLIVMQCSKSTEYSSKYLQDTNYDGTLCHSIQYRSGDKRYMLVGPRMSIGSTIVPGSNGNTLVVPDRRRRTSGEVLAQIRYSIPEEVKEGSVVGNIAKDLGLDINTLVDRRFRIVSGSTDALFQIIRSDGTNNDMGTFLNVNSETGVISSLRSFDFETIKTFQFHVLATDSGTPPLSSNVTVNVFILDQNDNVPVILYPVSSNGSAEGVEEVPRNVNAGHLVTKVRAYDADIGYNGWLLFSLQEVSDHSLFGLDRYTGQIRTLRSFTETDEAQHKLVILVKDNGNVSLSATATVIIKVVEPKEAFAASDVKHAVKDEEDSDVTFYLIITLGSVSVLFVISIIVLIVMQCSRSTDYSSKYLQDANYDGTLCHSIQYRSGDKRYMLVGPRMSVGSTIVPGSNGNTLVVPDRRRRTSGEFHVLATDSGTPALSSNVTVNVFILDQNDNVPVILYPVSSNGSAEGVEEVPRNVNAGHLVTKVRAYDADIGYNGWLLFSLQEVSDHSLFGLDRYTGQIRTLRSFTETDEAQHKLVILVKDNGNVSLSATATVIIKVVEPKEAFAASDVKHAVKDEEDSEITFYLIITLGSVSVLFVISIIVLIVMQCSKSTDYSSKYLQDANYDGTLCHSIQYRSGDKRYMLVGPRMSIGSTIVPGSNGNTLVVPDRRRRTSGEAFDQDINENAAISYNILRGDGTLNDMTSFLNINSETGVIHALRSFDFESMKTFQFHVLATDSGTPALSSNVTVNVFILDQNDNVPVILYPVSSNGSAEGVEEVPRNVNAGHLVTKVRAYDADIGYNGWLLFSLQEVSDHSLFGLDRYTGQIRTLRSFTETDEAQHKLVILVKDNGNVSLSATATVIIKVVEPKEAFAASDVKHAVKDEEDSDVTFYLIITLGSVSVLFVISIIVLIVMQCSKSTDYSSKYLQHANYDGTLCHSIQYRSGDKRYMLVGPRMSIGSTIVPSSNGNTLVVPDRRRRTSGELDGITGEIRVKGELDFEDTEVYKLDIQASDKGQPPLTVESRVIIKILDINDNKPDIEVTSLSNVIAEDTKPGTAISLISVSDKDSGINGKVVCSLSDGVPFELKPSFQDNMYSLEIKEKLDREMISHYDIVITATDLGNPPLSSIKTLSVLVSDVNDNTPEFPQRSLDLYLQENNIPGASVFSVSAFDKDSDDNAAISYKIVRGDGGQNDMASFININSETGVIHALKSFDFETVKTFQFHVLATDSGTPPLSSNVTVNVFILDQNDNVPVILYPVSSNGSAEGVEEVPRNVNAGHLVTKVRAYDADIGYNGWLLFSLQEVSDHSLFGLDRYTGQIRTLRSFTETDEAQHKLVILVKDNGNVSLSATATVIIKVVEPKEAFAASDVKHAVKDEEDSDVTFYLIITLGSVSVLFVISIIVLIVMQCSKSTDYSSKYLQDANYDGTLCHSIQYRSGDKRYMLVGPRMSIGSTIVPGSNGNTLVVPDRRSRTSGEFHVLATDAGTPVLSSNVTVNVFILDQNDNVPVILYPVSSNGSAEGVEEVPRNVNAGHLVTKVRAYDADIGYNGWLLFSLQEVSDHSLFGLDRYTGQIRTLRSFTETDEAQHKLVILVKDNGNVSLSATATVIIKVVEPKEAFAASDVKDEVKDEEDSDVTFYLIITLGSVSVLFVISIIVLIAMQCSKSADYSSKYLQDTNYDGTLCHSIQYRSGDKRYMLVGPRMSIGSTIVPGSNGNTLTVSKRRQSTLEIRYSIAEESKPGSVVGNIAKDLGFDLDKLTERRFRIVSASNDRFLQINQDNGALYVSGKIDREELCEKSSVCSVNLKTVAENPLEVHYIEVEIRDINDHSPSFPVREKHLEISENAVPQSTRVPLDAARDLDAGVNSLHKYILSPNSHFELDVKTRGEDKIPFLILKKPLDREQNSQLNLTLTAYDGGKPERFGSVNIVITVVDINDNAPVFDRQVYTATVEENISFGTSVVKVHASDVDEGANGKVTYAFDKSLMNKAFDKFEIDADTGEITVKGLIDFEEQSVYEIDIQASDKGPVVLIGHCSVVINVKDVNDNVPEIDITAISSQIPENSNPGAAIALISASDRDSGENGIVICRLIGDIPFELKSSFQKSMYSLVTKYRLDREAVSTYSITIMCSDRDQNENAQITYHIAKDESFEPTIVSFLNMNSEDGNVYALKSFDFETIKTFQFHVLATDSGTPALSSNVTVNVFILDQNDNVPVILYPISSNGSAEGVEEVPRNVNAGHLVTKVRAYDADIGYNGWLLFSLQEVSDHSLFGLDRYTGQIRTLRSFTETDEAQHKLVILVKDNGNVSLSATATVIIKVVEPKEAFAASDVKHTVKDEEDSDVSFYLIITLGSVSVLFVISIIVLIVMQCSKSTDYSSKYLQDANYDGTLCHSIQYRSGDKRYMLVGPRMSIGSTIVPGSNGNTLVVPDRRRRTSGESFQFQVLAIDSGTPALSSNVTVNVFILDQNDNVPVILYPVSSNGSAEGVEEVPRNVNAGHLVTKVRAYDADIGYNGWLLFSLQEVSDHSLFGLDRYTGQIRTLRSFTETDEAQHKLVILVKDNGNVSLSATATVIIKVVESKEAFAASDVKHAVKDEEDSDVTFYLIITLGSVSVLFVISIIVLIVMQCSKSTDYSSKYLQDANYDGTLCHSIQYRSGDKRYMLVGPRMSIGSTIVPGSNGNTLVVPDRRRRTSGENEYSWCSSSIFGGRRCANSKMEQRGRALWRELYVRFSLLAVLLLFGRAVWAQIRYSIPEEQKDGTMIGNIAKDLGIDRRILKDRGFRIVSSSGESLFKVNQDDGGLYVDGKIDREELCERSSTCLIKVKIALENPLEIHYVTVEILDVNDHAPTFNQKEKHLEIWESAVPGARFQLQAAQDFDRGSNSVQSYKLSHNDNFRLDVKDREEDGKIPFLVLQKPLDSETARNIKLLITAVDGGKPPRSGTMEILIDVLDINDNAPVFTKDDYTVMIDENAPIDSGTPALSSNVTVNVFILDQNDNVPVILYPVSSNGSAEGVEEVPRNVNAGHLVTKVRAYDADIGYNGWLLFSLQEVSDHSLFGLDRYTGQIRTLRSFTETDEAQHKLVILVKDNGNVSLSATATVIIKVVEPKEAFAASDVKHTVKDEEDSDVTFYLIITLGSVSVLFVISIIVLIVMQCSKSTDYSSKYLQDANYDGTLCHSIQYRSGDKRYMLVGPRMSIGSTIVPGSNGNTLVVPDSRRRTSIEFHVLATDSGTPALSSNVTVNVFILDQNDNVPVILYPVSSNGSAEGVEEVPRNVNAGHLVTKVRAYDADIGYNGWLLFSLQEVSDHSLFGLDRYTGQIRTLRSFTETDEAQHKLVILVKDNGNVSLSATATVIIKVVEPKEAFAASDFKHTVKDEEDSDVTFYLIITLGSVSVLFVISIIVLIVMQCSKSTDYSSKYLQDANYDGTLCHSIQYRSGDKRYMLVGPRMSIGSTIVPSSNGNTLVVPDRRRRTSGEFHVLATDSGTPALSSNVTVNVFILDQNDNVPVILYPISSNGSAEGVEEVPRNVNAGHLVTKVRAYDADIGYNGWLLFSLQEVSDHSLFGLDRYTGQIRTLRSFTETDEAQHKLVILVKDNGNISLSATATVIIKVVEPKEAFAASDVKHAVKDEEDSDVTFYLIITLGSVSVLFVISIIVLIVMQCSKSTDYSSKYLQDANYDGTLCHSIQYRSGDKRYMLVGPRMSIGSTIVPGSNGNTLVVPDRRRRTSGEFHVLATDSGTPALSSNVTVNVFILDQNDNVPVILYPVSSNGSAEGVEEVPRNVNAGHLVTKVRAYDADIGYNGWLLFSLQEVSDHSLFGLDRYTGQIRTLRSFTETDEAQHKLVILVKDNGNVSLSATATVIIKVVEPKEAFAASDVKHTVKDEEDSDVTFYLIITLGSVSVLFVISIIVLIVMQCSKSTDYSSKYLQDANYDGTLCHSIQYRSGDKRYMLVGPRMSIGSTLAPGSNRNTLVIPDRRRRSSGEFKVVATDSGTPALSSNVTVNVFILDQNDNVPVILYPVSSNGSAEGVEEVPRNVNAGHLVTKVRAYDADIGYNGWLLFSLQEVSDHSLFGLDRYTGQIRTLRSFTETDEAQHKLVILVKDNGNVSLSATATVIIKVVEPKEAFAASDVKHTVKDEEDSDITFYLIITLGSVSVLFVISIIVLIVMQCSKSTDYSSKYLQDTNYDGTLCHSIQYRSGDKRYMLVGPRMSIGSTIVPGSNGNTLVVPDRRRRASGEVSY